MRHTIANKGFEPMVISDQPVEDYGTVGPGKDAFGWHVEGLLCVMKQLCK